MSTESKKPRITLNTPKGVAKYPWLNTPCKTFDPKGVYKTGLLLRTDSPECEQLKSQIDKWNEESYQETVANLKKAIESATAAGKGLEAAKKKQEMAALTKAAPPYAVDLDKTTGEETGYTEFKFKQDAQVTSRKTGKVHTFTVQLFDAVGNPLKNSPSIYGGSTIKVNFTPQFKYVAATKSTYVTLQLNAVQVLELVSGGLGTTASDFGFETEEGYIYEQPTEGSVDNESIPPSTDF